MDWGEFRSSAGVAANITSLVFRFAELFKGKPTPELRLKVRSTGSESRGITFTAEVSEIGNSAAIGTPCVLASHSPIAPSQRVVEVLELLRRGR